MLRNRSIVPGAGPTCVQKAAIQKNMGALSARPLSDKTSQVDALDLSVAVGHVHGGLKLARRTDPTARTAPQAEHLMGDLRRQAALAGGLGLDGGLEALRVEVQWGGGGSRGGVLAEGHPFLFGALALALVAELWNVLSM
jgi:hypothetical protein